MSVPIIGIGAGNGCDGQVLVYQDMLGMYSDFTPKFVKKYAQVGEIMGDAFGKYIDEIKTGVFPDESHSYKIDDAIMNKIIEWGEKL